MLIPGRAHRSSSDAFDKASKVVNPASDKTSAFFGPTPGRSVKLNEGCSESGVTSMDFGLGEDLGLLFFLRPGGTCSP